jgi:transposase, IS6 family
VDKTYTAAYPGAVDELKQDKTLKAATEFRQSQEVNNIIEQEHRNGKCIVQSMIGFQSFHTARRTVRGIEAMAMICKGQGQGISQRNRVSQAEFINEIFRVSA